MILLLVEHNHNTPSYVEYINIPIYSAQTRYSVLHLSTLTIRFIYNIVLKYFNEGRF